MSQDRDRPPRARNLSVVGVAGLAGFVTVFLAVGALLLGLLLDSQFGLRGPFTIGLVVVSVPVSLLLMVRIALSAARAVPPPHALPPAEMTHAPRPEGNTTVEED
ncbi:MAG: hypothetical protein JW910_09590 [Anaerolineae bacterium]|nr:hypothetical protein [Anaerolineae bacterium]